MSWTMRPVLPCCTSTEIKGRRMGPWFAPSTTRLLGYLQPLPVNGPGPVNYRIPAQNQPAAMALYFPGFFFLSPRSPAPCGATATSSSSSPSLSLPLPRRRLLPARLHPSTRSTKAGKKQPRAPPYYNSAEWPLLTSSCSPSSA
jgi:hypothetical protein